MMSRFFAREIKRRDASRIVVFGGPHCAKNMSGERIAGLPEVVLEEDKWTIASADKSFGGLFEMTVVVGNKEPEVLTDWRKI